MAVKHGALSWVAASLLLGLAGAGSAVAERFYRDDPLPEAPPPRRVEDASVRKLSDYYDLFSNLFGKMGELWTEVGHPIPARAVNTLGEPIDRSWWAPRHYYQRMSIEELKAGAGAADPPSRDGPWTITAAKAEGVTPGFYIKDADGTNYVLKFDPIDYPELATGVDMISSKILHAVGYHVPEYYVVHFAADDLQLGDDVQFRDALGQKRRMRRRDVIQLLLGAPRSHDGRWRAIASKWLPGKFLGEFRFYGTRSDDPNDLVPHEHRRDLRGYRVFCAWLNHDDSRAINTLDMLVDEDQLRFIKHYLIDFGSTLGSGTWRPNSPRNGAEYLWEAKPAAKQFFSLGLWVPEWAKQKFKPGSKLRGVGNFESEVFDPKEWKAEYPNPAFVNSLPDDTFWAAKQVMAFTDEEIRAMVETAQYSEPRTAEYITKNLIARRDKIGRAFFAQVLPIDKFRIESGNLVFEDLEVKHGFVASRRHTVQWSRFNNETEEKTAISGATTFELPDISEGGYLAAEIRAPDRDKPVTVYVRKRGGRLEVVGIDRSW